MTDVEHTPAGGSPPRPLPKVGDLVEVVKLPDVHDDRLKMGQRGLVVGQTAAVFWVQFNWGAHRLNVLQIELK